MLLHSAYVTGRKDPEVEAYTTPGEDNIVFYSVLENNAENLGQTAELSTDVHKPPVYNVLEATYVSAGEISGSQDPYTYLSEENKTSDNTYATLDQARSTDNCATPLPTSSENSKTNSSEAIYTTLSAERDENNVYSSLCKTSKDGETGENSLASLPGMNNSVQDYVFLLN